MRFSPSLLSVFLVVGCPSRTPPASEPPEGPAAKAPEAAPEPTLPATTLDGAAPGLQPGQLGPPPGMGAAECIEQCMKASMAEARSPESIRADCEASCGEGDPMPIATAGDLVMHIGKRVQAEGVVVEAGYPTMGTTGWAVALGAANGPHVWVSMEGAPTGWDAKLLGQTVRVDGTLGQGPTKNGERIRIPYLDTLGEPVRVGEPE